MEVAGGESLVAQVVVDALHGVAVVEEDDAALVAQRQQQLAQRVQLVFLWTVYLVERDALRGLLVVGQEVYHGAPSGHVDKLGNLLGIGGRQQYAALQPGQTLDELLHLLVESHFQTLVELVDDEIAHGVGRNVAFVQVVVQSARGAEDNLRAYFFEHPVLVHGGAPAVAGRGAQAAAHVSQHCVRLERQLASRRDDQCLYVVRRCIDELCQGQQVGQRLAGAGG